MERLNDPAGEAKQLTASTGSDSGAALAAVRPGLIRTAFAITLLTTVPAACNLEPRPVERRQVVAGADADAGRAAFRRYGCTSCHTIPGVRAARGKVGPPLTSWAQRRYVAGEVPNEPAVLVRFIRDPHSVAPRTAMPNLGVSEADARNMAAYLYRLR